MSLFVVDANIAGKWCLPSAGEPYADEAANLLRRFSRREVQFLVPDIFWPELANLLWNACRRARCSQSDAVFALRTITDRKLHTVSSRGLLSDAFLIATAHDRTVHDSLYVALAVHEKAVLVTADERLANALAAHFPVRWLGAL